MTVLGTKPLTVGSLYTWQATVTKDQLTWDLSALAVTLWWRRPDVTTFSRPADSATAQGVVTYSDPGPQSLLNEQGVWAFSVQVAGFGFTAPVPFTVVNSP